MEMEIATIARHHQTNFAQARGFCDDVLRMFMGEGPSLGIIAWAVQQRPRDSALQVAKHISARHPHLQLKLSARSSPQDNAKTAQAPNLRGSTQSPSSQISPNPLRKQSLSQPSSSASAAQLHYRYSPRRDAEQEPFLPGAQRRSSAELKKNRIKDRVSPQDLEVCEHGIRWPSNCKVKGCIFYAME